MIARGNFGKLLEPGLRKIFFEAYAEKPEEFSKVFNVMKSKKAQESDYHVSGFSEWTIKQEGGDIDEEDPTSGQPVSYVHQSYAKMIKITREMYDDDQYNIINKMPKKLGKGGKVVVEKTAADILNNSFTSNGYDGVPLFSNSHPLLNSASLDDNLTTGTLTDANLKIGMTLMTKQVDQAGLKIQAKANNLIIPPDLEWTALTILQSVLQAGVATNDKNVIKSALRVIILSYLTSTTAWFIQDKSLSELNFFWRVKPEFKGDEQFTNMVARYRGYLRFSVGYSDYRGLVGSTGSGG
jgi:phage major head subunit gpT-like protein